LQPYWEPPMQLDGSVLKKTSFISILRGLSGAGPCELKFRESAGQIGRYEVSDRP
jgi:hypothetical protein